MTFNHHHKWSARLSEEEQEKFRWLTHVLCTDRTTLLRTWIYHTARNVELVKRAYPDYSLVGTIQPGQSIRWLDMSFDPNKVQAAEERRVIATLLFEAEQAKLIPCPDGITRKPRTVAILKLNYDKRAPSDQALREMGKFELVAREMERLKRLYEAEVAERKKQEAQSSFRVFDASPAEHTEAESEPKNATPADLPADLRPLTWPTLALIMFCGVLLLALVGVGVWFIVK